MIPPTNQAQQAYSELGEKLGVPQNTEAHASETHTSDIPTLFLFTRSNIAHNKSRKPKPAARIENTA
jgi:hypothetical protein